LAARLRPIQAGVGGTEGGVIRSSTHPRGFYGKRRFVPRVCSDASTPESLILEPSTITNMNGFVGLAYLDGMVTQTDTTTGTSQRFPFVNTDMRFMQGNFRGADGRIHQGTFAFV
jgi:hypothetical protein